MYNRTATVRAKCAAVQEIEIYADAAGAVRMQHSQQLHMLHGTSSGAGEGWESAIALSARPLFFLFFIWRIQANQCAGPTRNKEATRFTLKKKNKELNIGRSGN